MPSDVPVSLVFFVPITAGSTYDGHKLVERDNSLPGAPLGVAPLDGAWFYFRLKLRLEGG
jgi:hypothetical protein